MPIIKTITELLRLIDRGLYLRFILLQLLIIISGFAEIVSFFAILPFLDFVMNPQNPSNSIALLIYEISGVGSSDDFIFYAAILILILLVISLILTILRMWFVTLFANKVGFSVGDSLFKYYITRDFRFHISKNSSYLNKQITVESIRVKNMMKAFMQVNSDLFMLVVILLGLLYFSPVVTMVISLIIGVIYLLINLTISGIVVESGRVISIQVKERFKIINNGFGGIVDVILTRCQGIFAGKMEVTGMALARATTIGQVFALAPAKILQTAAAIGLVAVILFVSIKGGDISQLFIAISAFIMAGYKVMPLFQSVYASFAIVQANSPAIDAIKQDLSADFYELPNASSISDKPKGKMFGDIELEQVCYTHPGAQGKALNNVTITFKVGDKVGIIGSTGAGKSTLIRIIASLTLPDSGSLKVGGARVDETNAHTWKDSIAFISQDIFLLDGTILENIAFGIDGAQIDLERAKQCVVRACLGEFVDSLPQGLHTEVGERGVQLSGGQRQRIGIARALYRRAKYLIMDEGTSSLDQDTERSVINEIVSLEEDITLIMIAHRLNTLRDCNVICLLDQGEIVENGPYDLIVGRRDINLEEIMKGANEKT